MRTRDNVECELCSFVLFGGSYYYPEGGMSDLRGTYDTVDEAEAAAIGLDWWQVVDGKTWVLVKDKYRD